MFTDDTNLDAEFDAELRALLADGRKIEAIKRYREATGADLAAAKEAVEAMVPERPTGEPSGSGCLGMVLVLLALAVQAVASATVFFASLNSAAAAEGLEKIGLSGDQKGFVYGASGRRFVPWGFNYDHDEKGRLLEDYWEQEWEKVEEDFREMKQLGANVVRIHLQVGKFMIAPDRPNEASLARLGRLVALAEQLRLYLDITGLGCYHKQDVPDWYDRLNERERWDVQARFWEAVASRCSNSPAIFCYDLMNEPVVPGGRRNPGEWLGPAFAGKHFVQFITLEPQGRPRAAIARQWCRRLVAAIRKHDQEHLVTVGLVPWSLDRPGLTSGFVPKEIAPELDFIAVHLYPERGKLGEALDTLQGFSVGKPVVIEETFPLKCTAEELGSFLDRSRSVASGWIGFYWGKTPEEYRQSKTIQGALMLRWLELFQRHSPLNQEGDVLCPAPAATRPCPAYGGFVDRRFVDPCIANALFSVAQACLGYGKERIYQRNNQ